MTENKNKWYAFIPNFLTLMNLISGAIAIYFAFSNNFKFAFILMLVGAIFDFFDGFVARALKVSGELGKQLDSLSDMVTFGLLPGVIVFSLQRLYLFEHIGGFNQFHIIHWIFILIPLLIPALSALRLGRFNIDTHQRSSFIGLPTPANAIFWSSLTLYITSNSINGLYNPIIISLLVIVFAFLLNAKIPLFALKFKDFSIKNNWFRYLFLLLSLIAIILFQTLGFSVAIIIYIVLSIILNITKTN